LAAAPGPGRRNPRRAAGVIIIGAAPFGVAWAARRATPAGVTQ
jgi:hypothetical protein